MVKKKWRCKTSESTSSTTLNWYCCNDIIVWGTGKCAIHVMEEINSFDDMMQELQEGIKKNIVCFVDSNEKKWGEHFYDKTIKNPIDIPWSNSEFFCIVAIENHWEVTEFLARECVLHRGFNYVLAGDFIQWLHWQLAGAYDKLSAACMTDSFMKKLHIANIEKKLYASGENIFDVRKCIDGISAAEITSAMRFLFLDEIPVLQEKCIESEAGRGKTIKTIGIFSYQYGAGGAERVVSHLIPLYKAIGYNVILLTMLGEKDTDYILPDGITRIIIPCSYRKDPDGYFRNIEDAIRDHNIDLLCIHTPYEGAIVLYTATLAKLMGIYCMAENHTSFVNFVRQRNGLRNHDKIYRMLDHLVVLSQTDQLYWSTLGCACTYIPNPCVDLISPCRFDHRSNTILWVGRLDHKYKRILDVIPIMREVLKRFPEAKLLIVGRQSGAEDFELLKTRIQRNHLEQRIVLCGEQKDVARFYNEADILLMTSPGEGFPMVLAEAMSCSLPVVMYDLPYLEIARNGGGILSVPQSDVRGAAQKIIELLQNEDLYNETSLAARKNIEHFLNYDIAGAWKKVFQDIETGNGRRNHTENVEMALIELLLSI